MVQRREGYELIAPDDGGRNAFLQVACIGGFRAPAGGARVRYETREGEKGPQATNVRVE